MREAPGGAENKMHAHDPWERMKTHKVRVWGRAHAHTHTLKKSGGAVFQRGSERERDTYRERQTERERDRLELTPLVCLSPQAVDVRSQGIDWSTPAGNNPAAV